MPESIYEVTIRVADKDGEVVKHLEAPLQHATPEDVVVDLKNVLDSRSGNKVKVIDGEQ